MTVDPNRIRTIDPLVTSSVYTRQLQRSVIALGQVPVIPR